MKRNILKAAEEGKKIIESRHQLDLDSEQLSALWESVGVSSEKKVCTSKISPVILWEITSKAYYAGVAVGKKQMCTQ